MGRIRLSTFVDFPVRIHDNGKGIDPAIASAGKAGHFGLAGMQERATRIGGQFRLLSREGKGTEIELGVPGNLAFPQPKPVSFLAKLRSFWKSATTSGN